MRHLFPLFVALVIFYIFSCANQGSPTGGPKDTIPPTLLKSTPENKSLNYTSQEFQYEFDERINADQLRQKLNITPRTDNKFKVLVKKNVLTVTFEEPFEDSTTYTFNFADGVGDITEKNPVVNFTYAFSTGPIIDSIYISGTAKELYTNEPLKKIVIGLYSIDDTLDLFTGKPRYFTQTDDNGNFIIENIKASDYRIYAFDDQDKNLENDPQKEQHGFNADTLNLFTSKDSLTIVLQLIDASPLSMIRSKNTGLYFDVLYSKFLDSYQLQKIDSNSVYPIPINNLFKDNTIIRFYPDGSIPLDNDSLQLQLIAYDSLGNSSVDTVFVQFKESKRKPEVFDFELRPSPKFKILDSLFLQLDFSKPISTVNLDSFSISYDSLQGIDVVDTLLNWNTNKTQVSFSFPIDRKYLSNQIELFNQNKKRLDSLIRLDTAKTDSTLLIELINLTDPPKEQIKVKFYPSAFISIDSDSSQLLERIYQFLDTENTGEISGIVETEFRNYTLQLITKKFDVVDQLKNPKEFKFVNVKPGSYGFRILIDADNDGKWSPGNILKNIEPEPIHFHSEFTDLKAGWFVENIQISF